MNASCHVALAAFCLGGLVSLANAYETDTHTVLTREAVNRSVLRLDPAVLKNLGLEKPIDDNTQQFPNSKNQPGTILDLLEDGAGFEDNVSLLPPEARVRFHFYNPVTGEGLSRLPFIPAQTSSPDWALAPSRSISGQEFSYWDARQYLLDALTKQSKTDREKAFGLTFQALGHVVHHLSDMAQPQHVRNDVHCDKIICVLLNAHAPSFFETWTNRDDVRNSLPVNPGAVGYDVTSSLFTSIFSSPRRFWHTELPGRNSPVAGKGIAEFTNRNFVSAGTNFDKPQQPSPPFFALPAFDPAKKSERTVAELCSSPNLIPPCPPSIAALPDARLTFYETTGHDNFLNAPFTNPRASTESIFDERLRVQGEQPVFALNRFNFDEAYKHLLPRAVAYSAGMINYFFRGKLDFKRDEGDSTKYRIVNLGPEAMSGRFALYYDAIDGNRYPVAVDPADPNRDPNDSNAWRLTIAARNPAVPNSNRSDAVSFIAPANDAQTSPKVANEYVLVFNGDMGEEREDKTKGMLGAVAASITGRGDTVSLLIDPARIPGIDTTLLDPAHSSFGLVLPEDSMKLPNSFKAGAITDRQYLGMIANHAFRAQHPAAYARVETYLRPPVGNPERAFFRYFPELDGGTFLIKGSGVDELGNFVFTLTWLDKANANAAANLGVTIASGVLNREFGAAGSSTTFLSEPSGGAVGADSTVGIVRSFWEPPLIERLRGGGTRDLEVLEYKKGVAPAIKISYPLPPNSFGPRGEVSSFNVAEGVTARTGSDYYLAGTNIRLTIRFNTNEFAPDEEISRSGVLFLVDSLGATLFSDDVPHVAVPGAQNGVRINGVKVKKGATIIGYTVPYTLLPLVPEAGGAEELHQRTHLGTEFVTRNAHGLFLNLGESQMAISGSGKPAIAFKIPFETQTVVKVWGADLHILAADSDDSDVSCAWTPDDRYLFVVVEGVLHVFSAEGIFLGSKTDATAARLTSFSVTGGYTLVGISEFGVVDTPITIVDEPDKPFSITLGPKVTVPPVGRTVRSWGVDDTRRPYE